MIALVFVLAAAAVLAVLCVPAARAPHTALGALIVLVGFVHIEYSFQSGATVTVVILLVATIGAARGRSVLVLPHWSVTLFIGYMLVSAALRSGGLEALAVGLSWWVCLGVFAVLVTSIGREALATTAAAALAVVVVEFLLACSEVFLGANAVWPRRDGVTFRLGGGNNLLPFADGRAMGTAGYAITLGLIAAFCVLVLSWRASETKRWRFVVGAVLGLGVVLLSGTRTAVIALALAFAVVGVSRARYRVLLGILLAAVVVFILADGATLLSRFGLSPSLAASDSVVHRSHAFESLRAIAGLPPIRMLFGTGSGAIIELYESGIVSGVAGIEVFDNEYLRTFATTGFIGLLLLVVMLVAAFVRGSRWGRALILSWTVSLAFYDTFTWRSLVVLLIASVALAPLLGRSDGTPSSTEPRVTGRGRRRPVPRPFPAPPVRQLPLAPRPARRRPVGAHR